MDSQDGDFRSACKITARFNISRSTLVRWANEESIRIIGTTNTKDFARKTIGKRLYCFNDVKRKLGITQCESRKTILYGRVSSSHQKMDLTRQLEVLQQNFPGGDVYSDIASGINFKRKGFCSLLQRVMQGNVERIVVTHKDRLCRFAFDLIEWLCGLYNTKIVVFFKDDTQSDSDELSEDLISIVTHFVAKSNGKRAGKHQRQRTKHKLEHGNKATEIA